VERELFPPLPHLCPPRHRHLPRIQARREFPPPTPRPHSSPGGTPKLPPLLPCLLPFIVSTIGLRPCHILRQGDPPWGAVCIPKILHKNACALRKHKLIESDKNVLKQTHPGIGNPSPFIVYKRPPTLQAGGMRSFLPLLHELLELSAHSIVTIVHLQYQIAGRRAITSKEGPEPR
jgi:hypothetical protein